MDNFSVRSNVYRGGIHADKGRRKRKKLSDIVDFTDIVLGYADGSGELNKEVEDGDLIEKDAKLVLCYTYENPDEKIDSVEADINYYLEVSPHLVLPELKEGSPLTIMTDEGAVEFGRICASAGRAWITFAAKEGGFGTVLSD